MRGSRFLRNALIGAVVLWCGTVHAQTWKATGAFGWLGVGKAYEIGKGHQYWLGEISGSFANDKGQGSLFDHAGSKCPGFNDVDGIHNKSRAGGYCVLSDPDGDQAFMTYQCEGNAVSCSGTADFAGGTGKYKDVAGHNTFVAHVLVMWPDGTMSGYSTWNR